MNTIFIVLPILTLLMFDLGLTLKPEDFRLILTRPKDAFRKSKTDKTLSTFIKKTFPASADALAHRADTYNRQLQGALACEKEGRMTILAPESIYGIKTLTKDVRLIKRLYRDGFLQAQKKLPEVFETYGRKK